jgi:hypothetical protein
VQLDPLSLSSPLHLISLLASFTFLSPLSSSFLSLVHDGTLTDKLVAEARGLGISLEGESCGGGEILNPEVANLASTKATDFSAWN